MSDLAAAKISEAFATNKATVVDDIPRRFDNLGDSRYRLSLEYGDIVLELDRFRRRGGAITGELLVKCRIPGARVFDGVLSCADFNVSSASARTQRAKTLVQKSDAPAIPWDALIEEFAIRVLAAERAGDPAKRLRDFEMPAEDDSFTVAGLQLLRQHPVILFGDGGSAKSLTALFCAGLLEERGTRVLYCDWEFSPEAHRARLERLFGPSMPGVWYARCDRALVYEADRIRRIVREQHIDYVICDSVALPVTDHLKPPKPHRPISEPFDK